MPAPYATAVIIARRKIFARRLKRKARRDWMIFGPLLAIFAIIGLVLMVSQIDNYLHAKQVTHYDPLVIKMLQSDYNNRK